MTATSKIVTLLTDFGLDDEYAGVLKGVLLSCHRELTIVDLSHQVPPQNIAAASHLLMRSYRYFPPGTVHLVVVDPGVGSERPILALDCNDHLFVGPDNGLFVHLLNRSELAAVHRVTVPSFVRPERSATFHGRDIMAPVAAALAAGMELDRVGPPVSPEECTLRSARSGRLEDGTIYGEIVHIDWFGNLTTNITKELVDRLNVASACVVDAGEHQLHGIKKTYSAVPPGRLVALFDSHDFLEIAVHGGSGAEYTGLVVGAPLTVRVHQQ